MAKTEPVPSQTLVLLRQNEGLWKLMQIWLKMGLQKQEKGCRKSTPNKRHFFSFFSSPDPPKIELPCGSGDNFWNRPWKNTFFLVSFLVSFLCQKINFFRLNLARLTTSKHCFLQGNLSIFMFYRNLEGWKNGLKKQLKNGKKWTPEARKCASFRGEMVGCEKAVFIHKKSKNRQKMGRADPVRTLVFAVNSYDFDTQQKTNFGLRFGSLWTPHAPRTLFFAMKFNDFRNAVWKPRTWNLRQFHVFEALDPEICDSFTVFMVFTPQFWGPQDRPRMTRNPPGRETGASFVPKTAISYGSGAKFWNPVSVGPLRRFYSVNLRDRSQLLADKVSDTASLLSKESAAGFWGSSGPQDWPGKGPEGPKRAN